ncbi:MAG TPA: hypothetical protein VK013_18345 [Myxococcaceae bacterium]|nr:hypothetical protein [Myxococcaceae bacterium]
MPETLNVCLVDMNNGVANQATRCFRRLVDAFSNRVREANPGLRVNYTHVEPRNRGTLPEGNVDLVLSSGGPGAPTDGIEQPWGVGYRRFLDGVVEANLRHAASAPQVFLVCHSFQIAMNHFRLATVEARGALKFGVFPSYTTREGEDSPLFEPFGDRLFTWEYRAFHAVGLDTARLAALGGRLLARESRPGRTDKGEALTALEFAPGIIGTQFHPEADRPGISRWVDDPSHADELREHYGEALYERMVTTIQDPERLGKTFSLVIPGWLARRFNRWAAHRDLKPIALPVEDLTAFNAPAEADLRPHA